MHNFSSPSSLEQFAPADGKVTDLEAQTIMKNHGDTQGGERLQEEMFRKCVQGKAAIVSTMTFLQGLHVPISPDFFHGMEEKFQDPTALEKDLANVAAMLVNELDRPEITDNARFASILGEAIGALSAVPGCDSVVTLFKGRIEAKKAETIQRISQAQVAAVQADMPLNRQDWKTTGDWPRS